MLRQDVPIEQTLKAPASALIAISKNSQKSASSFFPGQLLKMASKMIQLAILVVMMVSWTFVESMPMMDSSSDGKSSLALEVPEGRDIETSGSTLIMKKRSVLEAKSEDSMLRTLVDEDNDEKIISAEKNDDDLETAAGTNVLRPLFVYRQQLAYRERARKAGRRSAPNFS